MARAAAMNYSGYATYGSEAYDLDRVPGYYERYGETAQPGVKPGERAKPRVRTKVQTAPVGISPLALIGFALSAVLLVFVLLSYVQLAETSQMLNSLETQITELDNANKRLTVEYEKAFNLVELEDYALNTLHMTKLNDSQVIHLNIEHSDKAEVLSRQDNGIFSEMTNFISSMMAYFK